MRRRIEPRAVLIGRKVVGRGDEAMFLVGELLPLSGCSSSMSWPATPGLELRQASKPGQTQAVDRLEGVGEIDVLAGFRASPVELPQRRLVAAAAYSLTSQASAAKTVTGR